MAVTAASSDDEARRACPRPAHRQTLADTGGRRGASNFRCSRAPVASARCSRPQDVRSWRTTAAVSKDGADVLLIHAGVNDRRSWQHVVERLGPRHRCVAYDTRGYGETDLRARGRLVARRRRRGRPRRCRPATPDRRRVLDGRPDRHRSRPRPSRPRGRAGPDRHRRTRRPYPDLTEGPTAELNARIEAADAGRRPGRGRPARRMDVARRPRRTGGARRRARARAVPRDERPGAARRGSWRPGRYCTGLAAPRRDHGSRHS